MAFTPGELTNIANASLDWYLSNNKSPFLQAIQQKPLLAKMEAKKKSFPGGKGDISVAVKGNYGDGSGNDVVKGYTHDDTVTFFTPANIKRANYPWREHHIGLTYTHTEAKHDGISINDEWGKSEGKHSKRELHVLVNLLQDKMEDFGERWSYSMNRLLWGDGAADAKALAGIQSMLTADPTTGTVGGIDRSVAANSWWRNRARTAAHAANGGQDAVTSSPQNGGVLMQALTEDYRQLVRFQGKPDTFLAGSDFIAALEIEQRANGYYSPSGFSGEKEMSVGTMKVQGVPVEYDPTLDDLSLSKRGYWFDSKGICLYAMENEWRKTHNPARPTNQFVVHKSITDTGQMVGLRLNSSLVVDIT